MESMDRARTIWIISKYASCREYGFESRLFALAREFYRNGRQPIVVASDSNHLADVPRFPDTFTEEVRDGVKTLWVRTLRYSKTASLRRVASWFDFELKLLRLPWKRLGRPDVIIVSSLSLLTILNGVRLSRKYGARLVFEIRDIWPLTLVEEGGFGRRHPLVLLLGWIERYGYRHADLIVGTMPNLTEHVDEVVGSAAPCVCVPFGFDPRSFENQEPLADEFLEKKIPGDRFVVGYAGSIGLTNALETIIEVARRLANDRRFFFVFLGGGDRRDQFMSETADLDNVRFLPKVKRSQVQSVLKRCDLLYFAAYDSPVWKFGMSLNKLIDYMMAAKPVLASYSGYPSMLDESGCGGFVPADNPDELEKALLRYADTAPRDLELQGEKGRQWLIRNRTWSVLALRYQQILDELVESSGPGHAEAHV